MDYEYRYFWKPTPKEQAQLTYNNYVNQLKESTKNLQEINDNFKRNGK